MLIIKLGRKGKNLNKWYTFIFEEFEETFKELVHKYENMKLKNEEKISSLNVENKFLTKVKHELENENNKLKMKFN